MNVVECIWCQFSYLPVMKLVKDSRKNNKRLCESIIIRKQQFVLLGGYGEIASQILEYNTFLKILFLYFFQRKGVRTRAQTHTNNLTEGREAYIDIFQRLPEWWGEKVHLVKTCGTNQAYSMAGVINGC